ncbi:hypothetical protein ACFXI3_33920 [Amycolatopsis sp. NPDC059235]|uniref:hypothetical protein n=1 Tax=Amycolatopsis sp. NPDC059235 TaxID=3346782 RepID=UPI00366F11E7
MREIDHHPADLVGWYFLAAHPEWHLRPDADSESALAFEEAREPDRAQGRPTGWLREIVTALG